jgi:two-component system response regulator FlrC
MQTLQFRNRTMVVGDDIMARTLDLAARAARSQAPVLICGESGTGKELIARFIHEKGGAAAGPFVSINCAAIPEGLMESELFGYERGAFTGAVAQRIGKFERAHGGTLLLDEVSEMPLHLQAKLLRVLQENEIDRLGGTQTIPIRVRILATTNRDPIQLVAERSFRADLYYRLNVIRIECRPLRGRPVAIEALAGEFLRRAQEGDRRPGSFAPDALDKIRGYAWPGNIRELQNAVERAVLLADGEMLRAEHFDLQPLEAGAQSAAGTELAEIEQRHILRVLAGSQGNRSEAAKRLGISVRTLRNKLKEYRQG